MIRRLIAWLRALFTRKAKADPLAGFNRRQRRAITFASSAEKKMRLERTAARWAKRHQHKRKSDNGAKYMRAYAKGVQRGGILALNALRQRVEAQKKTEQMSPAERAKRGLAMLKGAA
jgi:hypothetical protein